MALQQTAQAVLQRALVTWEDGVSHWEDRVSDSNALFLPHISPSFDVQIRLLRKSHWSRASYCPVGQSSTGQIPGTKHARLNPALNSVDVTHAG